jgi:tetratricopeptide (TPR) repeat protein
MRLPGSLEVTDADVSFQTEISKPALPGVKNSFIESPTRRPRRTSDEEMLVSRQDLGLERSLQSARAQVLLVRSSTTMATLAQLLEATNSRDEAITAAREALALNGRALSGRLVDPAAAQIALEVLTRLGRIDDALAYAQELPVGSHANLMVGAALASVGRFDDARSLLSREDGVGKDAILAFLSISEGNYAAAVPILRAALRRSPDDADSAHNLSIALWALGSRRKARGAALQATRSAPGREDVSLHYLELLLTDDEFERSDREVESILQRGVAPTARLLVVQARARLGMGDFSRTERLLSQAAELAKAEGEPETLAEVLSNLAFLRFVHGKLTRDDAKARLWKLHAEFPLSDVVVANLSKISVRLRDAEPLRVAFDAVRDSTSPSRAASVEYQIAMLKGQNQLAAEYAEKWLELEPENPQAVSAAMVALGIGMERWDEAAAIALRVVNGINADSTHLNNVAYIFAMAGKPEQAVELLEAYSGDDYVLKATLGLAYLASDRVDRGMKMYRQAAEAADTHGDGVRSLMTVYQALLARQLGLLDSNDAEMISAISLPPVDLPDDWRDRPEFLRLQNVALKNGYGWPLTI